MNYLELLFASTHADLRNGRTEKKHKLSDVPIPFFLLYILQEGPTTTSHDLLKLFTDAPVKN